MRTCGWWSSLLPGEGGGEEGESVWADINNSLPPSKGRYIVDFIVQQHPVGKDLEQLFLDY